LRVAQPELVEPPGIPVDERHHSELLREPSQLAYRGGFLDQIHEVSSNTALGEESKGLPRIGAFLDSENLYFQSRIPDE
jgi:hypothetical protein